MKFRLVILFFLSVYSFATVQGQLLMDDVSADTNDVMMETSCVDTNDSFQVGEKLEYDLFFNWTAIWLKAGVIKFSIKDGDVEGTPALHCIAEARTPRSFDWIYKVRDKYESYLDYSSLNPLRFVRDVNEGDYTKQLQYTYSPADTSVNVDYYIRRGKLKAENELLSIPNCTQDLLSSLYFARSLDYSNFDAGDSVNVDLFMDKKMYEVSFKFLGKDTIKHDGEVYRCNKFVPRLIQGGVFEEGDQIIVWVTDDENKLPLLIESDLNFGKIKAYLKKSRGLRNEVTSIIE